MQHYNSEIEMPQKKKLSWKDHTQLLEYLTEHSVKSAAIHFKLSQGAIRNRLHNIRVKLQDTQTALNRIRILQKISPRIRKLTTIGGVPEIDMEEQIRIVTDDKRSHSYITRH